MTSRSALFRRSLASSARVSSPCAHACVMAESSSPSYCALRATAIGRRFNMRDQPDLPGLSQGALRVLREDQPSQREIDAAYRRFARVPKRLAPGLLVPAWLLAGLVMGIGIASGASAIAERVYEPAPRVAP